MHETLGRASERRTVVVHGLGGIGKTQLTVAYIKRHRSRYSAAIWLNAKDEVSLRQSFSHAATRILREHSSILYIQNAVPNQDLSKIVEAVKRWLNEPKNDGWLIVYDNYDNVD